MKLCDGKYTIRTKTPDRVYKRIHYLWLWDSHRPKGIKRIRLTCPKCKRRIMSSIEAEHDGHYIYHSLPPHKPKGWWKRKKKSRREKRVRRR